MWKGMIWRFSSNAFDSILVADGKNFSGAQRNPEVYPGVTGEVEFPLQPAP